MKAFNKHLPTFLIKGKSPHDLMKTKNFYLMLLFLSVIVLSTWLLMYPSANMHSIHSIVSETHKQISNIKNIPSNIRHADEERLAVDHKYLDVLGYKLTTDGEVKNKSHDVMKNSPVIVVPARPSSFIEIKRFFSSVQKYLPDKFVLFYDLGLGGKDAAVLKKTCNSTKNNCEVKQFAFNNYPSHVRSLNLRSYVPICIQESLNEYGAIIWSDPSEYFLTRDISSSVTTARKHGIAAWNIKDSTSSITYPKMFTYFDVKPDNYYFHKASKTTHLIVFNTDFIRSKIMLPWIKCALVEECISPTGSQTGYCIPKKPRYLYSGCHHYEQSALNLILGKAFSFDETPYACEDKVFGTMKPFRNATMSSMLDEEEHRAS